MCPRWQTRIRGGRLDRTAEFRILDWGFHEVHFNMKSLIWTVAAGLVGVGSWLYWRRRKRQRTRLISLVALLREPATFDPVVLARVAGKVWNADLGDGDAEGADGFVAGAGIINTIIHGGRMYLINCMPRPYLDDPEAVEGNKIYGKLGNDPADLGPLKLGSNVHVQAEDLNDWCYIDSQGNLTGGFTIAAAKEASRRHVGNARKNR